MDISQISSTTQVPITPPASRQATSAQTGAPSAIPAVHNNGTPVAIQASSKQDIVDPAELKRAVDAINQLLKPVASNIEFSIDQDSGRTLVKVVDTETNTVIRQTPSREVLAIAKELDKLQGLLIREKA
ncbi:flagellar protein FlaG [Sulfuriferula sp.]|uniref:flagellar protein FlaG n=1 Tax=Sulfuriferula sp. TaxID=2025307 RepID=UPI0027303860|nr:flagellar protein FlaG [Sulfuriferula sp.]MDP2025192.1 flagellar protein FlaG [Sulfuriferula sp.]